MLTKRCSKCKRELPLNYFQPKDKSRLRADCRDCYNMYRRVLNERHPYARLPLTPEQRTGRRLREVAVVGAWDRVLQLVGWRVER